MLLSLIALHDNAPDRAFEYADLARTNAREFLSDESVLITWYVALAELAIGSLERAQKDWVLRQPLEPTIENWLELGWLRRVLQHLLSPAYTGEPALDNAGRQLASAWEAELRTLQASFPAPPALAAEAPGSAEAV
jgi:hypothetical protein